MTVWPARPATWRAAGRASAIGHGAAARIPTASGTVLADRIRSTLGPLEARMDLPHIHVMAEDHIALLHGDVATAEQADQIEAAVAAVSGVEGVESYLHVGLLPSDTRPSDGARQQPPSAALRQLLGRRHRAPASTSSTRRRHSGPSWRPSSNGFPPVSASRSPRICPRTYAGSPPPPAEWAPRPGNPARSPTSSPGS